MIISDLNYIESVSDETQVLGGRRKKGKKGRKTYGKALAKAGADALAIGKYSFSATYTNAQAVAGVFSSSSSHSVAASAG
ncbi:MAG: hypothetical protein AAGA75_07515 [Cyanobacteria bacterium P01_E01_bin.6]